MKTVVFYYSQSGQALDVAKCICAPLTQTASGEGGQSGVVFKEIIPQQTYPFPWNKDEFFDTFPESRLGLPPSGIHPIDFSDIEDADLVMIVGQSWFLSPSLPLQSFFHDDQVRQYLNGRQVVFVNVCRNMWLMTSRKIKAYLKEIGAQHVGHIVLQDSSPNLVSALTIVRWLLYGQKKASWLLPEAGISKPQMKDASRFGDIILASWKSNHLVDLQDRLLSADAIDYKPSVLFLEKAGHRMFGIWAKFVRRKGGFRDVRRRLRVNMFFVYLLLVLFVVSPFAQLFFYLTYPLHRVGQNKKLDCNI